MGCMYCGMSFAERRRRRRRFGRRRCCFGHNQLRSDASMAADLVTPGRLASQKLPNSRAKL